MIQLILGISTPTVVMGQSGVSSIPLKWVASAAAIGGTIAAISQGVGSYLSAIGSTYGSFVESTRPRQELGGLSYNQYSAQQYGYGYSGGAGQAISENSAAVAEAQRMAYQEQSPYYIQAAIEKEWATRQAEYYASQAYPMEYGQAQIATPQETLMPYKVRVRN